MFTSQLLEYGKTNLSFIAIVLHSHFYDQYVWISMDIIETNVMQEK